MKQTFYRFATINCIKKQICPHEFKLQFLTSLAVDNDNIKTTPVVWIISSVDFDVGPRASMQSTSVFFINKALAFHSYS